MIARIVNIYDQRNTAEGKRLSPKFKWHRVIRLGGTVLAGDFNSHSIRWDPGCHVQRNGAF